MSIYLAKTWSIKIHFDNVFRTKQTAKQNNLIHAVINKWPIQFEMKLSLK